MLPYGMIYYHGAPAELRDIPLGTHLNGSFYLPSVGEEKTIPPTLGPPQYGSKYNHAILLEDDFSFYSRRGQEWKVVSIDKKALTGRQDGYPSYQPGRLKVVVVVKNAQNGLNGEHETGGRGIVTITLFGGMDQSLYDEIKAKDRPLSVTAAENTLRTY